MKNLVRNVLLCLATFVAFPTAHASPIQYTTVLSGPNESPVNASPGTGVAFVVVDAVANTLAVTVTFSGLTGTTTASHIHCCTIPSGSGTAGVATTTPTFAGFPLGVTSGTYAQTFDLLAASSYNPAFVTANGGTTATAEAALLAGMAAGATYFNIHTTAFPGGEIRGFLRPLAVPEPWTFALFAIGLSAGLVARRRR